MMKKWILWGCIVTLMCSMMTDVKAERKMSGKDETEPLTTQEVHESEVSQPQEVSGSEVLLIQGVPGSGLSQQQEVSESESSLPQDGYKTESPLMYKANGSEVYLTFAEIYGKKSKWKPTVDRAMGYLLRGETVKAVNEFMDLDRYIDLDFMEAKYTFYIRGEELLQAGDRKSAMYFLELAGDWYWAQQLLRQLYREDAEACLKQGDIHRASILYAKADFGHYRDEERYSVYYEKAKKLLEQGDKLAAKEMFYMVGEYRDARKMYLQLQKEYLSMEQEPSHKMIWALRSLGLGPELEEAYEKQYSSMADMGKIDVGYTAVILAQGGHAFISSDLKMPRYEPDNAKALRTLYQPDEWKNLKAVAAGWDYHVGLKEDGTVITTSRGELPGFTDVIAISANASHVFGLRKNGTVICADMLEKDISPRTVLNSAVMIDAGNGFVVGVTTMGRVIAWGENKKAYKGIENWQGVVSVAAGYDHVVGLRMDGTVAAVGNVENNKKCLEVDDWENIVSVAAGDYNSVGLREDGTVVAVGVNEHDECRVGGWKNVVAIACHEYATVGITADGRILSTRGGDISYVIPDIQGLDTGNENDDGNRIVQPLRECKTPQELKQAYAQLYQHSMMDKLAADRYVISLAPGGKASAAKTKGSRKPSDKAYLYNSDEPMAAKNWTNLIAVYASDEYLAGFKADGSIVCTQKFMEERAAVLKDVIAVACGHDHIIGLKADGTTISTEKNYMLTSRDTDTWNPFVMIDAGCAFSVGLRADGTVVGSGAYGCRGVERWTDIVAISAGREHVIGLRADGTVVSVGSNYYGQCNVEEWTDIIAISAGASHSVGLKADGTVIAVGDNEYNQCEVSSMKNVIAIEGGSSLTLAVTRDGQVIGTEYAQTRDLKVDIPDEMKEAKQKSKELSDENTTSSQLTSDKMEAASEAETTLPDNTPMPSIVSEETKPTTEAKKQKPEFSFLSFLKPNKEPDLMDLHEYDGKIQSSIDLDRLETYPEDTVIELLENSIAFECETSGIFIRISGKHRNAKGKWYDFKLYLSQESDYERHPFISGLLEGQQITVETWDQKTVRKNTFRIKIDPDENPEGGWMPARKDGVYKYGWYIDPENHDSWMNHVGKEYEHVEIISPVDDAVLYGMDGGTLFFEAGINEDNKLQTYILELKDVQTGEVLVRYEEPINGRNGMGLGFMIYDQESKIEIGTAVNFDHDLILRVEYGDESDEVRFRIETIEWPE